MSLSELYTDLLCASSKDHILQEPINLACSHCVCKSCLPIESEIVECKICGIEQKITSNENTLMKKLLKINLPELFDKLEKQMSEEIRSLKGIPI